MKVEAYISRCMNVEGNISRCMKVEAKISRCMKVEANISRCMKVEGKISRCLKVDGKISRYNNKYSMQISLMWEGRCLQGPGAIFWATWQPNRTFVRKI